MDNMRSLISICHDMGVTWQVFTNATIDWVLFFSYLLDFPIHEHNIVWPDKNNSSYLKPFPTAYKRIESQIPDNKRLVFVDDTKFNLEVISHNPRWYPVHIKHHDSSIDIVSKIHKAILH
jgi:hypothetical protein